MGRDFLVVLETLGHMSWKGAQDGVRGEFLRWFPMLYNFICFLLLRRPLGAGFFLLFWRLWAMWATKGLKMGKGGISKVVSPLLPKGTLGGRPAARSDPIYVRILVR